MPRNELFAGILDVVLLECAMFFDVLHASPFAINFLVIALYSGVEV